MGTTSYGKVGGWALVVASLLLVPVAWSAAAGAATPGTSATVVPARTQRTGVAGADGTIGHDGRWLTDAAGRVVLLHGVNLVVKSAATPAQEGFDGADARWLVQHGFDVVRLGLTMADAMPAPGEIDTRWLASFERTVHALTSRGILVLIDLHQDGWGPTLGSDGFPEWMTVTHGATNTGTPFPLYYVTNPAIQAAFDSFWADDDSASGTPLQASVAEVFEALASAESSNPGVIGYDLLNEPWPGTTWSPCVQQVKGCADLDASFLDPYDARMDGAIRSVDPHHLVFGEPFVLFNYGVSKTHIALPGGDPDSGMSFHLYTATPATEPDVLSYARRWSSQTDGALLNTEFGATTSVADIDRQVDELDGALIPWIWWSFDGYLAENVAQPPSTSNTNAQVEQALVRPHPVLVAGTPTKLSYDEATSTLTFRYRTTGPTGTTYGPSAPTEIEVPASVYPSGWQATVKGGTVVAHSPRGVLEVVASAAASTVEVTIAPDGASGATSTGSS